LCAKFVHGRRSVSGDRLSGAHYISPRDRGNCDIAEASGQQ
jgi:hypothetical protein